MGSKVRLVRGEAQKEIVRLWQGLIGRHNSWQIWQDFVMMSADAISNCVDKAHYEVREADYLQRAKRYTKAELEVFAQMLGLVVCGMERDSDCDFLGELYMCLDLGNQHAGQFFTPYDVCRAMAKMTYAPVLQEQIKRQGWVSCNDPTCGAGALLLAFANECRAPDVDVNFQTSVLFVAQDIDPIVAAMCYIQLSLLGCAGYVVVGNSLTNPSICYDRRGLIPVDKGNVWYTPMYFTEIWQTRVALAKMELLVSASAAKTQQTEPENEESPAVSSKTPEIKETPEPVFTFTADDGGQLTFF